MKPSNLNSHSSLKASHDVPHELKLIFLDIDGVLNTGQHLTKLKMDHQPYADHYGPLFDPNATDNLRKIVDATGAKIVITSSWRYIHGLAGLRKMWAERNMPGSIHGITPTDTFGSRGDEVKEYLTLFRGKTPPDYLILDDECEYIGDLRKRLIMPNPLTGITPTIATKAIKMLSNNETI
ncbi:MAG: hypothetical protein IKA19_01010 [Muribaculaceae bacterium]|nr:hypothetical protein [Muribaculaceae bacterium]